MVENTTRIAVVAAAAAVAALVAVPTAAADTTECAPRVVTTVASGLGVLENLEFDGRGGLLLSDGTLAGDSALRRLTPDGAVSTVADVTGPGGIVVEGNTAYLNVGSTMTSGVLDAADGTIAAIDLDSGDHRIVATDLVMPNGLGVLPDGSLLVSRDIGKAGLSHAVGDGGPATVLRTDLGTVNGIEIDGDTVYTVTTFEQVNRLHVLDATDLTGPVRSIELPGPGLLQMPDDLTLGPDGALYVALNLAGAILRVDPETGDTCRVAEGIPLMSSVAFGDGPGWDRNTLYTTGFDGAVRAAHPAVAD